MPNAFEEATAKGAGKMGAVAAGLKGLRGVFNRLVEEHNQVSVLLGRALMSPDAQKRLDLWNEIRKDLLSHERAEAREVFAALERERPLIDILERHDREAQELESLILALDAIRPDAIEWEPALRRLQQTVQTHVEEEENEFFPRAQEAVGKEQALALEGRYRAARQAIRDAL